jgi:copper ion binding protein
MTTETTATFIAPDISCGHCVATVREEVGALAGVSQVEADAQTKQVIVRFDPAAVSEERIVATLDEAGYPVAR